MSIRSFINNKTLNSYLSDTLAKYDTDSNGFTQKEFSSAVKGMTTIFAKSIIKLTRYDKKFFKELDTNKDEIVSYQELANYVNTEYKLDFYSWMNLKVSDICKEIDNANELKKM
jgi:predicted glycosyltransferase